LCLAGVLFAVTRDFWVLLLAATINIISPSGGEVGPFLAIEQAALAQTLRDRDRTRAFAWYNLTGALATAIGALAGGGIAQAFAAVTTPLLAYRFVVLLYAAAGIVLAALFLRLSSAVETQSPAPSSAAALPRRLGLGRSRAIVLRLSLLFSLDAFAGGFVVQSIVAYWFYKRFGVEPADLGRIFFAANLAAGASSLAAAALARRFGLINTMVWTHLPSNVLLLVVPLMPTLSWAVTVLLLRFCISQMDVPTRQSYTLAVVGPDERSAASGITGVARTLGAALAPVLSGLLIAVPGLMAAPFFIAGGLKILYDLALYRGFKRLKAPEEENPGARPDGPRAPHAR
jgi:MFS family permease